MKLTSADEEKYLTVLSVTHYVLGGLVALFGCFPLIHLAVGIGLVVGDFPPPTHGEAPPEGMIDMMGGFFIVIAATIILSFWGLAAVMIATGRFLQTRRHHTFCLVVAFVESMFAPIGTALGVLTILPLLHPTSPPRFAGAVVEPPGDQVPQNVR